MDGFEKIVGKPLPQAEAEADKMGYALRIAKKDGMSIGATVPYSGKAINVEVSRGIVIGIINLG